MDKLLCVACLCVGRNLHNLMEYNLKQYYTNILNELPLQNTVANLNLNVCWECLALLKKALSFREQVKESYRSLLLYSSENNQDFLLSKLSQPPKLKIHCNEPLTILSEKTNEDHLLMKDEVKIEFSHLNEFNNIQSPDAENVFWSDQSDNINLSEMKNMLTEDSEKRLSEGKKKRKKSCKEEKKGAKNIKYKNKHEQDFSVNNSYCSSMKLSVNDPSIILIEEHLNKDQLEIKEELKIETNSLNEYRNEQNTNSNEIDNNCLIENPNNINPASMRNIIVKHIERKLKKSNKKSIKKYKDKNKMKTSKNKKGKLLKAEIISIIELSHAEILEERLKESVKESYTKAEFKCEDCFIGFNYKKSYKTHLTTKHSVEIGEYSCPVCKTVHASVEAFTSHYKRHLKRYECTICKKRTMDMKVMQHHFYSAHEISLKEYKCNICGKISNSIDTHRYHKDTHKPRIKCGDCDKTFSHRAGVINHRLAVHDSQGQLPCHVCGQSFKWRTSLKRHLEKHESEGKPKLQAAARCSDCGISFTSHCSFLRHLKNSLKHVTQDQLRYICDHCNRRFADKTKLRYHIEEKHLYRTFKCEICNKPSKNRVTLEQHVRNIHNRRPNNNMCHHCGKGFPTKLQLESHIRSHTGEKPFICEFCPTTFSQQSNLYKHYRQVHSNIKTKHSTTLKKRSPSRTQQTDTPAGTLNQQTVDDTYNRQLNMLQYM